MFFSSSDGYTLLQRLSIANLQAASPRYCTCFQENFSVPTSISVSLKSVSFCADAVIAISFVFVIGFFIVAWFFSLDIQHLIEGNVLNRRRKSFATPIAPMAKSKSVSLPGASAVNVEVVRAYVVELSDLPTTLVSSDALQTALSQQIFGSDGRHSLSSQSSAPTSPILFTNIAFDVHILDNIIAEFNVNSETLDVCKEMSRVAGRPVTRLEIARGFQYLALKYGSLTIDQEQVRIFTILTILRFTVTIFVLVYLYILLMTGCSCFFQSSTDRLF